MRCNWQIRKRYFTLLMGGGGGSRPEPELPAGNWVFRPDLTFCTFYQVSLSDTIRILEISEILNLFTILWYLNSVDWRTPQWTLEMMDLWVRTTLTSWLQLNPASKFSKKKLKEKYIKPFQIFCLKSEKLLKQEVCYMMDKYLSEWDILCV